MSNPVEGGLFYLVLTIVIAIDNNPLAMECAKHNAEIYGVSERIEFIQADFFEIASSLSADFVFTSPPWGGPSYLEDDVFDLGEMKPYSLSDVYRVAVQISPYIAIFLPRNSNRQQVWPALI